MTQQVQVPACQPDLRTPDCRRREPASAKLSCNLPMGPSLVPSCLTHRKVCFSKTLQLLLYTMESETKSSFRRFVIHVARIRLIDTHFKTPPWEFMMQVVCELPSR